MNHLRAETLKMIRRQLGDRFPEEHESNPAGLDRLAENLQALAVEFDVPVIEGLLFWIHDRYEGKDWSLAAWRAWCARYAELRRCVRAAHPELCQQCFKNAAVLTKAGTWWCPECGEAPE